MILSCWTMRLRKRHDLRANLNHMESGSGQVRYGSLRVRYILAQVIHGHRHECQCKPSF